MKLRMVVLAVCAICAAAWAQEGAETLYQKGRKAWDKGNELNGQQKYEEAAAVFEALAKDCPTHELADDALMQAARCARSLNKTDVAVRSFERVMKEYPDSPNRDQAAAEMADMLQGGPQPQYAKAAKLYEDLGSRGDGYGNMEHVLAMAVNSYWSAGDFEGVVRAADKYWEGLGRSGGRWPWAIQLKVQALAELKRFDDAAKVVAEAGKLPLPAQARGNLLSYLAGMYGNAKDCAKASEYYLKASAVEGYDNAMGCLLAAADVLVNGEKKDVEGAVKIYRQFLEAYGRAPQSHEAHLRLAQVYRDHARDRQKEIDVYKEFMQRCPDSIMLARAKWQLADACRGANRRPEAAAIYTEMLANPVNREYTASLTWALAWTYWEQQDYAKGAALFEELAKGFKGYWNAEDAFVYAVQCRQYAKDNEAVIRLADEYLTVLPTSGMKAGWALQQKVQVLADLKRLEEAIVVVERAQQMRAAAGVRGQLYAQVAGACRAQGDSRKAADLYLKAAALEDHEGAAGCLMAAAEVLAFSEPKEPGRALGIYAQFIQSYPKGPAAQDAHFRVAQVYRDALGKRGDEADTYREFLKKYPGSVQFTRAMWELAGSYRAQERNPDAMTTYAEIIAKFPKSDYAAAAMWELGQVQQAQGDAEKARATFEQLVKDKPGYIQADYARERLAQK